MSSEFVSMPGECDVCGRPATVERPATKSREYAKYCDFDARRSLGWGDTYHAIKQEATA